jgi:hypothetical protein
VKNFGEFMEADGFDHINEVVWPVLLYRGERFEALGTAVSVGDGIALTAWHYLTALIPPADPPPADGQKVDFQLYVAAFEKARSQILLWPATRIFAVPWIDIAILYLCGPDGHTDDFKQRYAHLDFQLPAVGTEVAVMGYRRAEFTNEGMENGKLRQSFHPRPTTSLGHILDVHARSRDAVFLNFPCFLTDAAFDDGMSGGPVFDNTTGRVIGLVCTSFDQQPGMPPTSYASLLWPVLGTQVQIRRVDLPEGASYFFHELFEKRFLQGTGWEPFSTSTIGDQRSFHLAVSMSKDDARLRRLI